MWKFCSLCECSTACACRIYRRLKNRPGEKQPLGKAKGEVLGGHIFWFKWCTWPLLAPWLSKAHSALHRAQTGREGATASQRKLWAKALDFQSQNSNTNLWHLVSTKVRVFFFSWVSFTSSCHGDSFSLNHYFMHFRMNFIALGAGLIHVGHFSLLRVWYTEVISFKWFLLEVVSMNCRGYEHEWMAEAFVWSPSEEPAWSNFPEHPVWIL